MRWKIIAVNSVILILVTLLGYVLVKLSLEAVASDPAKMRIDAERAVTAATGRLELDALRTERWLAGVASEPAAREPFKGGLASARSEAATQFANAVRTRASGDPILSRTAPSMVALVDLQGFALGRDGSSTQMRGDDLGSAHPRIKAVIAHGVTASELWSASKSAELLLVSYAAVRDESGQIGGVLVIGSPLNDGRLQRTSDDTSGLDVVLAIPAGEWLDLKARSSHGWPTKYGPRIQDADAKAVRAALEANQARVMPSGGNDYVFVAAPLAGYGDGKQAALIAIRPTNGLGDLDGLLWPLLAVGALGLLLVAVGGVMLDAYIARPIEEIEEGLLAILNGRSDLRFEIEHAELGGLVFRLNSLLNQLMGVQEDDTDDEGHPTHPPTANDFTEALAVDERSMTDTQVDPAVVAALRAEPQDAYYRRLFAEYVQAKRSLGDPVGHILEAAFIERIRELEGELGEKHGRAVRYRIEVRGREVVLLAVPLG